MKTLATQNYHNSTCIVSECREPPTPQSKNLVGNLILALSVEMIAAVWSLIVAWRGVRADEFTTTRREELVKETCSKAPTVNMISETGTTGSMPLAALYNLLQVLIYT